MGSADGVLVTFIVERMVLEGPVGQLQLETNGWHCLYAFLLQKAPGSQQMVVAEHWPP